MRLQCRSATARRARRANRSHAPRSAPTRRPPHGELLAAHAAHAAPAAHAADAGEAVLAAHRSRGARLRELGLRHATVVVRVCAAQERPARARFGLGHRAVVVRVELREVRRALGLLERRELVGRERAVVVPDAVRKPNALGVRAAWESPRICTARPRHEA